ncbi:MAG: hypothetical protein L0I62_01925 [Gammaproteobacteria bacterium]|nr:hypothetical protein [Gammaproteobacteria bacterium]
MNKRIAMRGAGFLAGAALFSASACTHESHPPVNDAQVSPTPQAKQHVAYAGDSRIDSKGKASAENGSAPPCGPPYYSSAPHTLHPAVVATVVQGGVSPPARSLPPVKSPPPGSKRVIPLYRVPPYQERCRGTKPPTPRTR